jgi:UDP-glucose 4-epimerase
MGMGRRIGGKRILVTGASGFIGAHLCRRLLQEGAEVHAVYRTQRPIDADGQRVWQADLAVLDSVREIISKVQPEIVFHLASHVKGAPGIEHVLPTFQSNLQSTVNLLTVAAETTRPRVVLIGSLAEPEAENGEQFPSAPYAAAKWACTGYARMFHALYQLPTVIARVFMVYGPAQVDLTKLVPYVTLSLLQGKPPKITSGDRLVDWIYVSDVVNGFVALAESPDVDGATVDLGSGSLTSIREIVQQLARVIGNGIEPQFGALPDRPMEPTRTARTADALALLGWKPEVPLQEGLERTVDWYRAQLEHSPETYQAVHA